MAQPDIVAVRALYDEHAAALWRYALRLSGDRARAEDVVQETLLARVAAPRGYRRQRAVGTGLAVHRRPQHDYRRAPQLTVPQRSAGRWTPPRHPKHAGPDEVNSALDRMLIGDAMAQLSAEHRAVVRRSYYLGWTTAQIAEDLQIAEGTVKSRLHYALRALRLALHEKGVTR